MNKKGNTMRVFLILLAVIFLTGGMSACTFKNLPPEQQQLQARIAFSNLVEGYLVKYRTADIATQQEWKKDVDPLIAKAYTALDLWGFALKLTDPTQAIEQQKIFLVIKDKILDLLIESFVEE